MRREKVEKPKGARRAISKLLEYNCLIHFLVHKCYRESILKNILNDSDR